MSDKVTLLRELGLNLTPRTLAAIVADLNDSDNERLTPNMDMALQVLTMAGIANAGANDFELMIIEAEGDKEAR